MAAAVRASCSWASAVRSTVRWAAAARPWIAPRPSPPSSSSGCIAHWVANSMASVLRGTGDMKTPGLALVGTAAMQIPLTGALTLGWFGLPAFGIRGPAIAAVIVFAIAAIWMLSKLTGPKAPLRLRWPVDGFRWRYLPRHPEGRPDRLPRGDPDQRHGAGRHRPDRPRGRRRHRGLRHRLAAGIHADPDQLRHRRHPDRRWSAPTSAPSSMPAPSAWPGPAPSWPAPWPPSSASIVALWPDLWLGLFTTNPGARSPRAATISASWARPTASSASPWRSTSPRRAPAR